VSTSVAEAVRLAAIAAREIQDRDVCFVGVGVPSLAAMAAKRHHAPGAVLIYESGAIDTDPPVPPLSTGSPAVVADAAMIASCLDVFAMLQQGRFDLGLLSAAQVDRFGNLNSTVLGPYAAPRIRLVGSGGAHDIASLAREILILMPHEPRRFVERVDFVTSPGLRAAANGVAGVPLRGQGPVCLVTPRARFTFEAGELTLDALAPDVDEADALDGFRWKVPRARRLSRLPPLAPDLVATCEALVAAAARAPL
jgi:glutaconate CoA-transferase, subunit B